MTRYLIAMAGAGLLCGIGLLHLGWAQPPADAAPQSTAAREGAAAQGVVVEVEKDPATGKIIRTYTVPGRGAGASTRGEISQLVKQLRDTTDEAKKAELTKKLETAVGKHFDEDMKVREAELARLEERLKKLKDQLERRRKAKAEILQLHVKVLVNEAEGLGFSGASFFEHAGIGGSNLAPLPASGPPSQWDTKPR